MKSYQSFMWLITLFSLGACCPTNTIPQPTITPVVTTPVVLTHPEVNLVTTIPLTEEPFTSTPTGFPTRLTVTFQEVQETPMPIITFLTITIIYDNNSYDQRLNSAWGFSALVEYRDHTLLFDTGGDGQMLMENMRTLEIDPTRIDSVMLSHAHADHTGGLTALLNTGVNPVVYLLPSFPSSFKNQIEQFTQIGEVFPGQSFTEGLWTTGELGSTTPEQALVIQTAQGLVVITGCAHPGIVAIVEQAKDMFGEPVRLVLGGFHLGSKSEAEISAILTDFRRLEVEEVAPCHCTGQLAMTMFAAEYGDDYIPVGVGSVIRLEVEGR